jgi:hypothetical protein
VSGRGPSCATAVLVALIACKSSSQPPPAPTASPSTDATSGAADELGSCEQRAEAIISTPPLPDASDERELVIGLRRSSVHEACEHGSTTDVLADTLVAIDDLAERITAARRDPRALSCTRVVATHYADARWRGKLDGFSSADRQAMIARSRDRMTQACTSEAWTELQRACVIASGGVRCFELSGKTLSWGYPAAGAVTSLGIADCDAYRAALVAITACSKLPESSRVALRRSFDEMQAHIASLPTAERIKLASGCRAGTDAIQQVAATTGC